MNEIWGVIWTRDEVKPDDEVTWYESKDEAVREFNGRGDNYWHCPIVRATVNPPVVMHSAPCPFDHGYDDFYFPQETFASRMERNSLEALKTKDWGTT